MHWVIEFHEKVCILRRLLIIPRSRVVQLLLSLGLFCGELFARLERGQTTDPRLGMAFQKLHVESQLALMDDTKTRSKTDVLSNYEERERCQISSTTVTSL